MTTHFLPYVDPFCHGPAHRPAPRPLAGPGQSLLLIPWGPHLPGQCPGWGVAPASGLSGSVPGTAPERASGYLIPWTALSPGPITSPFESPVMRLSNGPICPAQRYQRSLGPPEPSAFCVLTHLVPSAWPLAYSPPPAEHGEAERPLPGTQGGRSGARMEPAGAPELTFSITVLTRLLPWRCEWPGSVPPFVTCTTHTGVPRAPPTGRGPAARGSGPPASAFPTSPMQPAELGPACTRGPCRGLSPAPALNWTTAWANKRHRGGAGPLAAP